MINTLSFWKLVKKQISKKPKFYQSYFLCNRSTAFEAAWHNKEFREECSHLASEFLVEIKNTLFAVPSRIYPHYSVCLFISDAGLSNEYRIIREQFVDWNIKRLSKNWHQRSILGILSGLIARFK